MFLIRTLRYTHNLNVYFIQIAYDLYLVDPNPDLNYNPDPDPDSEFRSESWLGNQIRTQLQAG